MKNADVTRPPQLNEKPGNEQRGMIPALTAAAISEAVAGIRHGVVQIIIQDGRIIQIDKTEKIRLT